MRMQPSDRGLGSQKLRRMARVSLVGVAALVAAACGSTTSTSTSSGTGTNPGVPSAITATSYTPDINATMSLLKPLT